MARSLGPAGNKQMASNQLAVVRIGSGRCFGTGGRAKALGSSELSHKTGSTGTGYGGDVAERIPRVGLATAAEIAAMGEAIELARRGIGTTSPNPAVGCVILDRNSHRVGHGWHERAGEPHAEIHALRSAGDRARGGTAVVTLEPCSHHGRTPPPG